MTICNLCSSNSNQGIEVELVTGDLLRTFKPWELPKEERYPPGFIKKGYLYGNFTNLNLWFCHDCLRREKAMDETALWGYGLFFAILFCPLFAIMLRERIEWYWMIFFGGFASASIVLFIYGLYMNFRPTDLSKVKITQSLILSAHITYGSIIPYIVYNIKGPVYYWEYQDWKAWMERKPDLKVFTRQSVFNPKKLDFYKKHRQLLRFSSIIYNEWHILI